MLNLPCPQEAIGGALACQTCARPKACVSLDLPYPPSVNHYWRKVGNRMLLSAKGRAYIQAVLRHCKGARAATVPAYVHVLLRPPDRRRRDADNCAKALLDALVKAGVLEDDSNRHVRRLTLEWSAPLPQGLARVEIFPWDGPEGAYV